MTRKEALKSTLRMIDAGIFPGDLTGPEMGFPDTSAATLYDAFSGSLDAAEALHDAVLTGRTGLDIESDVHSCVNLAWLPDARSTGPCFLAKGRAETPARAWLIAIICALISQEENALTRCQASPR